MKYFITIIITVITFASNVHAQDIDNGQTVKGTVIVQQQAYNGTVWVNQKCDDTGVARVNITSNGTSVDPLWGTNFVFYEATSAVTNFRILTAPAGSTIYVKKYSIISMDDVNKGIFTLAFTATGSYPFAKGKIGVAPSGIGDTLYYAGENQGIWATTPGACIITIQYTTSSSH